MLLIGFVLFKLRLLLMFSMLLLSVCKLCFLVLPHLLLLVKQLLKSLLFFACVTIDNVFANFVFPVVVVCCCCCNKS